MKVKKYEMQKVIEATNKIKNKLKCFNCKSSLKDQQILDAWPNDKEEAFLYIECKKCGYQNALWKLLRRIV